jgi:IS30 family transposase
MTKMSLELESEAVRLSEEGHTSREVARRLGCSKSAVGNVLVRQAIRLRAPKEWDPSPARLSMAEREEIRAGIERGDTFSAIAQLIGRAVSTVSREVGGRCGRADYCGTAAHRRAGHRARRPKVSKLCRGPLLDKVTEWLEEWWSPEEIARRLRIEFPHDPMMWVSHETIYQSLFVQGRGELRRELTRCLRSGRAHRRPHNRFESPTRIGGMVMISERPAEAADRAVPGHWEGDLVMGAKNRSAVGTLVERSTRFVLLLHLPDGKTAAGVNEAMKVAIADLPAELVRSITWDQGSELNQHRQFTVDTGVQVYFCDPHSPWQRGSNENTNGLLRQYMPKGTDLSVHSAEDLARIARSLNNRPRETLGFMKPLEKLAELLALTG